MSSADKKDDPFTRRKCQPTLVTLVRYLFGWLSSDFGLLQFITGNEDIHNVIILCTCTCNNSNYYNSVSEIMRLREWS